MEIDSVIFDDDQAFGADQLGLVAQLQAQVDARQDLTEEITKRVNNGESLRTVVQELMASQGPNPSIRSPEGVYASDRQRYLKELSATADYAGEQIALGRVMQLHHPVRPKIQIQKGGE